MHPRRRPTVVVALAAIALALSGCSGSTTVADSTTSNDIADAPQGSRPALPSTVAPPDISPSQKEAGVNGMIETYNALVEAYGEASTPPVDPAHPVIQARTRGAAKRQINSYYQSLVDTGFAETNAQDQRNIVDVFVDSPTSGRIRECSVLASDLVDLETGEIDESLDEVTFADNFYILEDGIWKLDHWDEPFAIDTITECPVGMRDDPRINA